MISVLTASVAPPSTHYTLPETLSVRAGCGYGPGEEVLTGKAGMDGDGDASSLCVSIVVAAMVVLETLLTSEEEETLAAVQVKPVQIPAST